MAVEERRRMAEVERKFILETTRLRRRAAGRPLTP